MFGTGDKNDLSGAACGTLQTVRAYWEGLRRPGLLPRRDRIDPRGLAPALEQVFLAEEIAPGQARLRLAGSMISHVLGTEARGIPLGVLLTPLSRGRLITALGPLFRGEATLEVWLEAERGLGRPALEARLLLLPLARSCDEPPLALGCLACTGEVGRSPRRFAIGWMAHETLPRAVPVDRSAGWNDPRPQAHAAERAFAEPAPPTIMPPIMHPTPGTGGQGPLAPQRGGLRLVHSRD